MSQSDQEATLYGHPTGLFTLFFAEMWERFSYYGMRALLVFYMIKGFLNYGDGDAYKVYGAYGSLVYMTPFFGGMLADRLLGPRKAVVFGGMLMAAGHLLMTIESELFFFTALAFLIVGNGFFKPNISTMVGSLYGENDPRRDGGFTLFYIGINLGAAMAPLICGYVGETYGWHYGFGLATLGMLIGLAVFMVPNTVAQLLILGGAVTTAVTMVAIQDDMLLRIINGFVAAALVVSGVSAFRALGIAPLPDEIGLPPDPDALRKPIGGVPAEYAVYGGTFLVVPLLAAMVWSVTTVSLIPAGVIDPLMAAGGMSKVAGVFIKGISTVPGAVLTVTGLLGFGSLWMESRAAHTTKVERERLWVILVMMFFSMLFWSFFEQAGSSVSNFTDRNVDRQTEERVVAASEIGQTITFRVEPIATGAEAELPLLDQEQLGHIFEGRTFTMTQLSEMREAAAADGASAGSKTFAVNVDKTHVGMGIGGTIVPASTFQSANPIFIIIFGLVFSAAWTTLGRRGMEPSTPVKFALGLLQLGLGFVVMWWGAQSADPRGMTTMTYLLLGYLLHTTGELCLSPVGLSMVTKLSPKRLVSTAMGAWFLATAFSNLLAAIIATFTGGESHGGGSGEIPPPIETIHVYGDVFGTLGGVAIACAVLCFAMSPVLRRWMHED